MDQVKGSHSSVLVHVKIIIQAHVVQSSEKGISGMRFFSVTCSHEGSGQKEKNAWFLIFRFTNKNRKSRT